MDRFDRMRELRNEALNLPLTANRINLMFDYIIDAIVTKEKVMEKWKTEGKEDALLEYEIERAKYVVGLRDDNPLYNKDLMQ